mgnify:FL=1
MSSPSKDIADRLQALSLGTIGATSGWAISVAHAPEQPDSLITVYDTGSEAPATGELDVFRPALMIRVRAKSYEAGYSKQVEIREALIHSGFQGSVRFVSVDLESGPLNLGLDDANRYVTTANYTALVMPE